MKAVSDKVIQQTKDSIERPPGGGAPATEPDAAAVGADTVNKVAATAPKKIVVCSPYRPTSTTEECRKDELMANINRAKTACRILTTLGFLPMAPHLYFTQFLKDEDAQERNTGMKLGMDDSDETIAGLMTDGCNMGVKSLSQYLNQYKAADETSKDITRRLIALEERLAVDIRGFL